MSTGTDRFAPGDRVRTRATDPAGHTRLPRYARGAVG
ncbi:SH3-like domain-containing protein, partial [Modestobacter versicolor]